jgi:hypothetical protein
MLPINKIYNMDFANDLKHIVDDYRENPEDYE